MHAHSLCVKPRQQPLDGLCPPRGMGATRMPQVCGREAHICRIQVVHRSGSELFLSIQSSNTSLRSFIKACHRRTHDESEYVSDLTGVDRQGELGVPGKDVFAGGEAGRQEHRERGGRGGARIGEGNALGHALHLGERGGDEERRQGIWDFTPGDT